MVIQSTLNQASSRRINAPIINSDSSETPLINYRGRLEMMACDWRLHHHRGDTFDCCLTFNRFLILRYLAMVKGEFDAELPSFSFQVFDHVHFSSTRWNKPNRIKQNQTKTGASLQIVFL